LFKIPTHITHPRLQGLTRSDKFVSEDIEQAGDDGYIVFEFDDYDGKSYALTCDIEEDPKLIVSPEVLHLKMPGSAPEELTENEKTMKPLLQQIVLDEIVRQQLKLFCSYYDLDLKQFMASCVKR